MMLKKYTRLFCFTIALILVCCSSQKALGKTLPRTTYAKARKIKLSENRVLAGTNNAIFSVDANRRIVWEFSEFPPPLFDFAFIPTTDLIYVTTADNTMYILNAKTGKSLYSNGRNGSGAYGKVKPYLNDECLITDNLWGYRDRLNDPNIENGVTAWQGLTPLWSRHIPANSSLVIRGKRIFVVVKQRHKTRIIEIHPPRSREHQRRS